MKLRRPPNPLRSLLLTWQVPDRNDPRLAQRVWARLRREAKRKRLRPRR